MNSKINITEKIKFETSFWNGSPCKGKRLGFHWVPMSLFIQCWEQFQQSLETADWSKKQTAKTLFDSPNWTRMKFGIRIAIGRVLRYFVDTDLLNLRVINPKASGTKHYVRALPSTQMGGHGIHAAMTSQNQPV
jgi:hypothetical protein